LLDQAITYLKPGGVVLLEVDETHSIVDFRDVAQYFEVTVIQDTLGKNRFVRLTFTQQRFRA
jgi:methylase of polypeptide subunit release factors